MGQQHSSTDTLVGFARDLRWSDVPETARAAARLAILDSLGCMLSGSATDFVRRTAGVFDTFGRAEQAGLVGSKSRTSAPSAAFLNGLAANILDYDDAFERDGKGMGHPGASVIPAALAAAEHSSATAADFATAVVAGYEVANRIIEAIQPTPARHAEVWGVAVHQGFGAAVAAGRLYGLGAREFANAFGLAGTHATVPAARKWNWRTRPLASPKDVVAFPAETGVRCALLAATGWQGSRDILDGAKGFWIMAGSDRCDEKRLTDRLGSRWTVSELSFKPYPACRWVHAALEAAEGLMRDERLAAGDIRAVEVGSFADLVESFSDRRPATLIDGEFSLPWTMAAILAGLPKGPAWYADATLADPAMHALADRVTMVVDDEAQRRHFSDERKTMSVVRMTTTSGKMLERRVTVARGGLASPWPEGGIAAKFREQAAPVVGSEAAARLEETILTLGEQTDLAAMCAMLQSGTQ